MDIQITEVSSEQRINATIQVALLTDLPSNKDGWQFAWKSLYRTEGSEFYKLSLVDNSQQSQGVLMLSVMYEEMLYMNNIEVAPHNLGSKGKYDNVAGALISFACKKSFELGKNTYRGYLTFESKTKLIPLYQEKYGATLAAGKRMFIDPQAGLELIEKYLT
ncbi:MAG: hypothetical protein AB8F95_16100 [Bacteroidia bacterium]